MVARFSIALTLFAAPTAAMASTGIPVPEGSQFTLFALGVLGVIIGRQASLNKPGED